jgi:cytochrome c-type biogenesis protein CcmH/NrfG
VQRPSSPRPTRKRPPAVNQSGKAGQFGNTQQMRVAYIVISGLVICSMLGVVLATVDFSGFWDDETEVAHGDPNEDLVAEQQTVVAENPEDLDQVVLLANLLANTGHMQDAMEWYERALELDPANNGVRLDFARSLQENDLNADAEAQFLQVLDSDPNSLPGHYYLAKLYMDWQPRRKEEARAHYERVVEINPDSFLAEQAQVELDSMDQTTPIASPGVSTAIAGP